MEDKRYIKKRYIFINVIMIGLAVWLIILPDRHTSSELSPELLLREITDDNNFVSTDFLAEKIIDGDRHTMIIDVRTPEEYSHFHLKNAINIPLANILDKDEKGNYVWEGVLNQDDFQNILYSNGSVYANQAWMLTRRLNFSNNYVLEGGLNRWFETIIQPQKPRNSDSDSEFALYEFRVAASMYFGEGGNNKPDVSKNTEESITPPTQIIKKENVQEEEEGGC